MSWSKASGSTEEYKARIKSSHSCPDTSSDPKHRSHKLSYRSHGFDTARSVIDRIGLPNIDSLMQGKSHNSPFHYPPNLGLLPIAGSSTPVQCNDVSATSLQTHVRGSGGRIKSHNQRHSSAFLESSTKTTTPLSHRPPDTVYQMLNMPAGPKHSFPNYTRTTHHPSTIKPVVTYGEDTNQVYSRTNDHSAGRHQRQRAKTISQPSYYSQPQSQQQPQPQQYPRHKLSITAVGKSDSAHQQADIPITDMYTRQQHGDQLGNTNTPFSSSQEHSRPSLKNKERAFTRVIQLTRSKSESNGINTEGIIPILKSDQERLRKSEKKLEQRSKGKEVSRDSRTRRHSLGGASQTSSADHISKSKAPTRTPRSSSRAWHRVDGENELKSNPNLLDDINRMRNSYLDTHSFDMDKLPGTPPRNVSIYMVKAQDDSEMVQQPQLPSHHCPPQSQPLPFQIDGGHNLAPPIGITVNQDLQIRQKFSMPEPYYMGQIYERPPHIGAHNQYRPPLQQQQQQGVPLHMPIPVPAIGYVPPNITTSGPAMKEQLPVTYAGSDTNAEGLRPDHTHMPTPAHDAIMPHKAKVDSQGHTRVKNKSKRNKRESRHRISQQQIDTMPNTGGAKSPPDNPNTRPYADNTIAPNNAVISTGPIPITTVAAQWDGITAQPVNGKLNKPEMYPYFVPSHNYAASNITVYNNPSSMHSSPNHCHFYLVPYQGVGHYPYHATNLHQPSLGFVSPDPIPQVNNYHGPAPIMPTSVAIPNAHHQAYYHGNSNNHNQQQLQIPTHYYTYNQNLDFYPPNDLPRPLSNTPFWSFFKLPYQHRQRPGHSWREWRKHQNQRRQQRRQQRQSQQPQSRQHHSQRPNKPEAKQSSSARPESSGCQSCWLAPFHFFLGCFGILCSPCIEGAARAYEHSK